MRLFRRFFRKVGQGLLVFRLERKTKKGKALEIHTNNYAKIPKRSKTIYWFKKGPCCAILLKAGNRRILLHIDPGSRSLESEGKVLINRALRELKKEGSKQIEASVIYGTDVHSNRTLKRILEARNIRIVSEQNFLEGKQGIVYFIPEKDEFAFIEKQ